MSRAAVVIRQSQGTDDSVSLELQREKVPSLANELVDEIETFDFGNHTGFSIHSKGRDEERIDNHPEMERLVSELRAGEFEYLVAWDDTRISRDEFFAEVKRAVKLGDAEFAFVEDVEDVDSLAHGVQRTVETKIKQQEIEKAKAALERKMENSEPLGRPPKGLEYSRDRSELVPGDEFEDVMEVIRLRDAGISYPEIEDQTGIPSSTAQRVWERRERYQSHA